MIWYATSSRRQSRLRCLGRMANSAAPSLCPRLRSRAASASSRRGPVGIRAARSRQCRSSRLTAGLTHASPRAIATATARNSRPEGATGALACVREAGAHRLVRRADGARRHTHYQIPRYGQHDERCHRDHRETSNGREPFYAEDDWKACDGRQKVTTEELCVETEDRPDRTARREYHRALAEQRAP